MYINLNSVHIKGGKYDNIILGRKIYFGLRSKPNVEIIGIKVSMWKLHSFKIIFVSNNVMNIQYVIGKRFWYL